MLSTPLRPLKTGPLSDSVFETLRLLIFSGQFPPGAPLRELHLARELNVSQSTVRQALIQLEQFGLVVRTPNIGTEVTRLTPQDIRERVEMRTLLEAHAIRQAAPRMTEDAFRALDERLEALTAAIERNDYFEEAQADLAFHRFIWLQSGNPTLYRTLDQIAVPLFAFVSILRGTRREHLATVVASHAGLVQALRSGEPGAIDDALRQHFESGFAIANIAPEAGR
jgi:DNA-binding GntR family transcriptional regulator